MLLEGCLIIVLNWQNLGSVCFGPKAKFGYYNHPADKMVLFGPNRYAGSTPELYPSVNYRPVERQVYIVGQQLSPDPVLQAGFE